MFDDPVTEISLVENHCDCQADDALSVLDASGEWSQEHSNRKVSASGLKFSRDTGSLAEEPRKELLISFCAEGQSLPLMISPAQWHNLHPIQL